MQQGLKRRADHPGGSLIRTPPGTSTLDKPPGRTYQWAIDIVLPPSLPHLVWTTELTVALDLNLLQGIGRKAQIGRLPSARLGSRLLVQVGLGPVRGVFATGCIPAADLRRAMGSRGEHKPQWYMELKAASGDPLYICDRPQIAKADATGQLGDRARRVHQHLTTRGLIDNTIQHRPNQQPATAGPPAGTYGENPELLPKATWKRVGQKTAEITLTTAAKRRYRADGEMIDRLLAAAVSTGRLSDPKRLLQAPEGEDADLRTLPNGHRHGLNKDRSTAASAAPTGAKTIEITLIATTRRYLATDPEAQRLCAAAETLGALHHRSLMLTEHTLQPAIPNDELSHTRIKKQWADQVDQRQEITLHDLHDCHSKR